MTCRNFSGPYELFWARLADFFLPEHLEPFKPEPGTSTCKEGFYVLAMEAMGNAQHGVAVMPG